MVQDEVSRPALRQTVMTTNCGDTNHMFVQQRGSCEVHPTYLNSQ